MRKNLIAPKSRLIAAAIALVAASFQAAPLHGQVRMPTAPTSSATERALTRAEWPLVLRLIDTDRTLDPLVRRLLKAHALLATNQSDTAFCLFNTPLTAGDRATWESWIQGVTRRHPGSAAGHYLLADALARLGRWTEAFKEFQLSLERDPRSALALNARGVVFAVTGDLDRATLDLRDATMMNPLLTDPYLSKGYANLQGHVSPGARAAFRHALELAPNSALATAGLGYVEVVESRWGAGRPDIEAAGIRSACLAPFLADNLARIVDWQVQMPSTQLASKEPRDLGNTLNELLTDASKGKKEAIRQVFQIGLEQPELRTKIAKTTESIYKTGSATAKSALDEVVGGYRSDARIRVDQAKTLETVRSTNSLGVGVNAGTGKNGISVGIGPSTEVTKSGAKLLEQAKDRSAWAESLGAVVPNSKPGGLTTRMPGADNGSWSVSPHYTLGYSVGPDESR